MPIIVNLDVMLARRKTRSKELAEQIGISEQNVSLLKSGKVKASASRRSNGFALRSTASPAIFWNIDPRSKARNESSPARACPRLGPGHVVAAATCFETPL